MNERSTLPTIAKCAIAVTALILAGPTSAALVQTTMVGHIATIPPPLQGLGVEVGDQFGLVLTFDDAFGVHSQTTVNGSDLYQLNTDTFTTGMNGWYGSFATFLASHNPGISAVEKVSWFRPAGTLHHEDWVLPGFELTMVTNYAGNPGGQSYGWYRYNQNPQMAFLLDSVVTTPVPEPGAYAMLLADLGLLGVATRRRRPSEHHNRARVIVQKLSVVGYDHW